MFDTQSWVKSSHTNNNISTNQNKAKEKKLKLSYDLNNSIKGKPNGIVGVSNVKKSGKEIHSLYNICKTGHKLINININPSKTESNSKSKSKSKSKSTSRECSSNHAPYQYQIITSNLNKKVVKTKKSLINKSTPLLNGKLFSKINICPYPKPKLLCNKVEFTQGNQLANNGTGMGQLFKTNICSPSSKNNHNNTHYHSNTKDNQQKIVMSYLNHNVQINKKNNSTIQFQNKPLFPVNTTSTVQTQMNQNKTLNSDTRKNTNIDNDNNTNNTNSHRNKQIGIGTEYVDLNSYKAIKNDDQIKEIKNILDDNLRVMFNFSYENFLSKESETESKNNSIQEINSNEFIDGHYHTINHKSTK